MLFRKVFTDKFYKVFPNICFDMFAVWWIKPYYFPLARRSIYMLILIFELLILTTIYIKMTYIRQLTSNNIISCSKSHSEICPLKTDTAKTSWELLYCF